MKLNFMKIFIICLSSGISHGKLTEVVNTDKGPVQGEIVTTVHDSSIKYSAFKAIPYAKPPIGKLRFQPPVENNKWSTTLIATSEASSCPQITGIGGTYEGDEDCLYLNVYSPKTSFNDSDSEPLAVMVWIYGGGFLIGQINSTLYGPDFLIADNVVVVAMNYRVGALGFLSLDIDGATGNMGLKDQVLALKWVQKNIKNFGGDPNKVTIFGQSAGSVCVSLHQLSSSSKGLFRGAIAMSGSPLNPWGFAPLSSAVEQGFDFAKYLGIVNNNREKLLEQLRNLTAQQIVYASAQQFMDETTIKPGSRIGGLTFKPTYENSNIAKEVFLSECPLKIYESGNYLNIPIILGFTNAEIILFINSFSHVIELTKIYLESIGLNDLSIIDDLNQVQNNLKTNNSQIDENILYSAINATSDVNFIVGIDETQKYLVQKLSSVYYYRNSFDSDELSYKLLDKNLRGLGHSDDLLQVFWQPNRSVSFDPNSRVNIQRKKMVRLLTNFAKYLNPTPIGMEDSLLNVIWTPSGEEGLHLEIENEKMSMESRPIDETSLLVQTADNSFDHADCTV